MGLTGSLTCFAYGFQYKRDKKWNLTYFVFAIQLEALIKCYEKTCCSSDFGLNVIDDTK